MCLVCMEAGSNEGETHEDKRGEHSGDTHDSREQGTHPWEAAPTNQPPTHETARRIGSPGAACPFTTAH